MKFTRRSIKCHNEEKPQDQSDQKRGRFPVLASILSNHLKNVTSLSIIALIAPSFLMGASYYWQFADSVFSQSTVYANSNNLVRFYFFCALSFVPSFAVMSFQKTKIIVMSMLMLGFCSNIIMMIDAIDVAKSPILYLIDEWLQKALMTAEAGLVILWIGLKFMRSWLYWWLLDTLRSI